MNIKNVLIIYIIWCYIRNDNDLVFWKVTSVIADVTTFYIIRYAVFLMVNQV